MNEYKIYLQYVEEVLKKNNRDQGRRYPFRSRTSHTRRVLNWAKRLCEGRDDVDLHVLYTAVIFHDVGYCYSVDDLDDHQKESTQLFCKYAKEHNMDEEFINKVAACIEIHSDKERMQKPEQLTMEQLLLMEADLLDEEGALAICWDGLACGYVGKLSYQESLERSKKSLKHAEYNPMVTEKARRIWQEKKEFLQRYVTELENDLEEYR